MSKIIILLVCGAVLFFLFKGDQRKKAMNQDKKDESLKASGDMVKDPVCGTYVPNDADIRVRSGDKVYAFCSYECRDKFIKGLKSLEKGNTGESQEAIPEKEDSTPES